MKKLMVFMAVLAIALLGSTCIVSAGTGTYDFDGPVSLPPANPIVTIHGTNSGVWLGMGLNEGWAPGGFDVYGAWLQVKDNRELLLNPNGGVVGIGTSNPTWNAKLDVAGILKVDNNLQAQGLMSLPGEGGSILRVFGTNSGVALDMGLHKGDALGPGNGVYGAWLQVKDNRELLLNPNGGPVGIGTTNPTLGYKLDVKGVILADDVDIVGSMVSLSDLIKKVAALEAIVLDLPPGLLNQKDRNADNK